MKVFRKYSAIVLVVLSLFSSLAKGNVPEMSAANTTETFDDVVTFLGNETESRLRGMGRNLGESSNRNEVRGSIEARCDLVLFGDEVDWQDYGKIIAAIGVDVFGSGGGATYAVIEDILKDQLKAVGLDTLKRILNGEVRDVNFNGEIAQLSGGIATYNNRGWSYKCCWPKWNFACCCSECGKQYWTLPNSHQPYLCWKGRNKDISNEVHPRTAASARPIKIMDKQHEQHMCFDVHTGDNNLYMSNCHGGSNQRFYFSDGLWKSAWKEDHCLDW
eukprot:CAMPEP_0204887966 /NCGR_PEP_ID=MMETSP1349-20130617/19174_1 /ASSEMBLY_ACC=CAM_ASM_000710 /TAXON_ID=215587 /ORGANISM="Aplanochytrium stocchinoi, Strain GSBS06" /LENGTH=273 /DNA_ID=CAMNT_0052051089 /DNA_START=130 /DNA_END=948 /DNA_ORIENTATION=-